MPSSSMTPRWDGITTLPKDKKKNMELFLCCDSGCVLPVDQGQDAEVQEEAQEEEST